MLLSPIELSSEGDGGQTVADQQDLRQQAGQSSGSRSARSAPASRTVGIVSAIFGIGIASSKHSTKNNFPHSSTPLPIEPNSKEDDEGQAVADQQDLRQQAGRLASFLPYLASVLPVVLPKGLISVKDREIMSLTHISRQLASSSVSSHT
ncbi:MAG: hypothetical protein Q9173_001999 [Seirophora scorigena]